MKRTAITAAVLGLIISAAAAPVSAQAIVSSPVRFGIMGGATVPLSDLSDFNKTGWNAGALVTIGVPLVPVSFRIDGQWQQMDHKSGVPFPADLRIIDGTANVVYTFGAALPTKFYLHRRPRRVQRAVQGILIRTFLRAARSSVSTPAWDSSSSSPDSRRSSKRATTT